MIQRIESYFLQKYSSLSFYLQQKAKILLFFYLILIFLLIAMMIILNAIAARSLFSMLNIMIFVLIIFNLICLVILKAGFYNLSANLLVIVGVIGLATYSLFGKMAFKTGVITTVYNFFIFVVFSTLFCKRYMTILVFIASVSAAVTALLKADLPEDGASVMLSANYSFEAIFIFILCYLILFINDSTMKKLKEEAENREHYEKTSNLLQSVKDTSAGLAASSTDMLNVSTTFLENVQNQAATSEEITATIEEMSAGIDNIAGITDEQYNSMSSLLDEMKSFSKLMDDMKMKVMDTITLTAGISEKANSGEKSLLEMDGSMQKINHSSEEMASIINIINDISDKINLLSLNAAIEAARAGDSGRGFAVVADEISKLADQTSSSVSEIDTLIKTSENEIHKGLGSVSDTVSIFSRIIEGINSIDDMVKIVSEFMGKQVSTNQTVHSAVEKVLLRSEEIRNATREQKSASNEIVKSVSVINELSQMNSEGATGMVNNSEEIADISEHLNNRVDSFEMK